MIGNYQHSLTQQGQHIGLQIQCSLQLHYHTERSPRCSRQDTGIHWAHHYREALKLKTWAVAGVSEGMRGITR